jgi:protein gp37
MSSKYWDDTFNAGYGCTPVSAACDHCYAKEMIETRWKNNRFAPVHNFTPTWHEKAFRKTFKPGDVVFVCNMSDLFHPAFSNQQIEMVLFHIRKHVNNQFLVLTKRADRLKDFNFARIPNLWLGVTIENNDARHRIDDLLDSDACHKWISIEPLLSDLYWGDYFCPKCRHHFDVPDAWVSPCCGVETNGGDDYECPECGNEFDLDLEIPRCPHCENTGSGMFIQPDNCDCFRIDERLMDIDWAVIGCESGTDRRPCKLDWVSNVVEAFQQADKPIYVKQLEVNGKVTGKLNKFPESLRVRQFPVEFNKEVV